MAKLVVLRNCEIARMPRTVIRLVVFDEVGENSINEGMPSQTKYVTVVASAVIAKLNKIIQRENTAPVVFRNKQLAMTSSEAKVTAASPPKSRNDRNITESEKLSEKCERGIVRLILGARLSVKTAKRKKPQLLAFESKL